MSWFRTYRPTRVADLHLTHVRETLQQLMATGKLPQVMLFAGPKGTGKTSTARIIAALLNDPQNAAVVEALFFGKTKPKKPVLLDPNPEDSLVQQIHQGTALNVQELDAASHRGIDDVRALKERVYLAPQQGVMSVYILDEAHMLTTEAFNALLKLLEEPPAHAVFILATTEAHKVPSTVLSRATLITFTKASLAEMVTALDRVAKQEKIPTESAALELLAARADGSFRDGIKLLEMVATQAGKVTLESVEKVGLSALTAEAEQLLSLVLAKDEVQLVKTMVELRNRGVDQTQLHRAVLSVLHEQLLKALGVVAGEPLASERVCHFLLTELNQEPAPSASIPLLGLELKLLELIFRSKAKTEKQGGSGTGAKASSSPKTSKTTTGSGTSTTRSSRMATTSVAVATLSDPADLAELELVEPTASLQTAPSDSLVVPNPAETEALLEKWTDFLEAVKARNSSIAAVLRSAKPFKAPNGVTQVAVFYKFHQEQLQQPKFRQLLDECVQTVVGAQIPFQFILAEPELLDRLEVASTQEPESVPPHPASTPVSSPEVDTLATLAAEVLI